MKKNNVIVLDYDPGWKTDFEAIAAEIQAVLGDLALSIEHVGSTSVPGLAAKPIIDLDVVIADYDRFDEVLRRLALIGYIHEGNLGIPDREAFRYDGKPHLRRHHLYVCPKNSEELKRHLAFRDYLRTHPEARERYSQTKKAAARLYPEDMDGYIRYKSPCIQALYIQCDNI